MIRNVATIALLAALAAGCTPAPRPSGVAAPAAPPPVSRSLATTSPPPWPSRDATLPDGCSVSDHTGRLAVYRRRTRLEYPSGVLGLLDLRTGRSAEVVTAAIGAAERLDVLGRALSDEWLAWEEVSPGEAEWRLYAAPIDAERLAIGRPVLVASALTRDRYRPLFSVDASRVVWCSAEFANGALRPVVYARELPSGRTTELYRDDRRVKSVRLRDDTVLVVTEDEVRNSSDVTAVDARSGRVLTRQVLGNAGPVSHHADSADGVTAWAAWESPDRPWPAVYVDDGRGACRVATLGCDPTVRAGRVLLEVYGEFGEAGGIDGVDPASGTRFTLVPCGRTDTAPWQLVAGAACPDGLAVAYQDERPFPPPDRGPVTRVRIWETR